MDRLSYELVLQIVEQLYTSCFTDAYILHLRVVNKCFNEAILHAVFMNFDGFKKLRLHTTDCLIQDTTNVCPNQRCLRSAKYGAPEGIFARSALQGRMSILKHDDDQKHKNLRPMKEAAEILRRMAEMNPDIFDPLLEQLLRRPILTTNNSVFLDLWTAAVCDAATTYEDIHLWLLEYPESNLHERTATRESPMFWLMFTAYYLGSPRLLTYLQDANNVVRFCGVVASEDVDPMRHLSMIIRYHPVEFSRSLIHQLDDGHVFSHNGGECPLREAVRKHDSDLVASILRFHSPEDLEKCCRYVLPDTTSECRIFQKQCAVLSSIWLKLLRFPRIAFCCTLSGISWFNDVAALRSFLAIEKPKLWPFGAHMLGSALAGVSVRGDLAFLRCLIDNGYLSHIDHHWPNSNLTRAARLALHSNNLRIFLELELSCLHNGFDTLFFDLAAAEGTIPLMQKRIQKTPSILTQKMRSEAGNEQPLSFSQLNVGQTALDIAVRYLKPSNVEYLLGLGITLHYTPIVIEWSYYSVHKEAYSAVQRLLRKAGIPLIQVRV